MTAAFGGVGLIYPSGLLSVSSGGSILTWQQSYQQTIMVTGYPPVQSIIVVNGSINIMPQIFGSSIGVLTVAHSIRATYYSRL